MDLFINKNFIAADTTSQCSTALFGLLKQQIIDFYLYTFYTLKSINKLNGEANV